LNKVIHSITPPPFKFVDAFKEQFANIFYEYSIFLVKYFNSVGSGTWIITEAEEQENSDWLLFGYCHIFCWKRGYVILSEPQDLKLPFCLTIERDLYIPKGATVK